MAHRDRTSCWQVFPASVRRGSRGIFVSLWLRGWSCGARACRFARRLTRSRQLAKGLCPRLRACSPGARRPGTRSRDYAPFGALTPSFFNPTMLCRKAAFSEASLNLRRSIAQMPAAAGTKQNPWILKTPPGSSEFQAYKDPTANPPALVVHVGKTELSIRSALSGRPSEDAQGPRRLDAAGERR
jgi:hypothetical protein